jgi:putative PIN family toxin of toxin-antitoxin system
MIQPPKVVFDTTIILQAILHTERSSAQALEYLTNGKVIGYLSSRLLLEYETILYRPSIRKKYPKVTDESAKKILDFMYTYTEEIRVTPSYITYERDRNDEPSLNLCIGVKADFLLARDRDLLDLNKDRDFKLLYPFLQIVTPEELVKFIQDEEQDSHL